MRRFVPVVLVFCFALSGVSGYAQHAPVATTFSGESALQATREVTAWGPRPVDSAAHRKLEALIVRRLRTYGCAVEEQVFTAQTPIGPKRMNNIIARATGRNPGPSVVLTGHYDTKIMEGEVFVGANDGGSSTGFLLEMARTQCGRPRRYELVLVWLDGEEAIRTWTAEDSLYGSRHLAQVWKEKGVFSRTRALINVDMIGDRDLSLVYEWNSTPWLRKLVWDTAAELGYARHFPTVEGAIEDDHIPFLRAGASALDLIDFNYGPGNGWWHTKADTIDKLAAGSFQVVGNVLVKVLEKLEK